MLADLKVSISDLVMLDARDLSAAIQSKQVSCAQVMAAYLDHIECTNPKVNAIVSLRDRETLLREADFLSLHVPLSPETHHLISAPQLALMKSTAFIINTSRGKIVEEAALIEALQSKRLAGAGLDVFEFEPQIHPALLAMPNVVVTPHMGTATGETRLAMSMSAAENLLAALAGERPRYLVNPEAWKK